MDTNNTDNINETKPTKNILTFTGGGALSFTDVGTFAAFIRKNKDIRFHAVYGVSGGGLISTIISNYIDYEEAVKFMIDIDLDNSSVYSIFPLTKKSLLNSDPLRKTIHRVLTELESNTIKGVDISKRIPCYIGATCLNTGLIEYYDINQFDSIEKKVDLLMATTSIPLIFPSVSIKGLGHCEKSRTYIDGGVIQNDLIDDVFYNCGDANVNIYYFTYKNPYLDNEPDVKFKGIFGIFHVLYRTLTVVLNNYNMNVTSISSKIFKNGNTRKHSQKATLYVNYGTKEVNFLLNVLRFSNSQEFIDNGLNHNDQRIYDMSMF